ncbi:MAG: hypothetical protein H0W83_07440 [Planctomycetes bacterium]|nr:hypothetical protein [Planctomycetota bacterium]
MHSSPNASRRGNIVLSMCLITALMGLSFTAIIKSTSSLQQAQDRELKSRCWIASESAVNEALSVTREHPEYLTGTSTTPQAITGVQASSSTSDKITVTTQYLYDNDANDSPPPVTTITNAIDYTSGNTVITPINATQDQYTTSDPGSYTVDTKCNYILRSIASIPTGTKTDGTASSIAYSTEVWFYSWKSDTHSQTGTRTWTRTNNFQQSNKGIAAKDSYDFQGSPNTDSWDSTKYASYAAALAAGKTGTMGDISSNGTLNVQKAGNVKGTATSNANIAMNFTYQRPAAVTAPGGAAPATLNVTGGNSYFYTSIGSGVTVNVSGTGTATIYLEGPLNLSNTINYAVGSTAKLWIFQGNYNTATMGLSDIHGNGASGCVNDPIRFLVATDVAGDVTFNGNGSIGGIIIAPNANFKLNGTFNFMGSLMTKSMDRGTLNGNFQFHYDEKLRNMDLWNNPTDSGYTDNVTDTVTTTYFPSGSSTGAVVAKRQHTMSR